MIPKFIYYVSLVEGILDELFIKQILLSFTDFHKDKNIQFHRDVSIAPLQKGGSNKSKVQKNLSRISQIIGDKHEPGVKEYLLIAGVDSDKDDFEPLHKKLSASISVLSLEISIVFVAIKDIETWAEYLLKPEARSGSLEKGSSKAKLYTQGKSSEENAKGLIASLKEIGAFKIEALQHLCSQTSSFQHFHHQIVEYLQKIS